MLKLLIVDDELMIRKGLAAFPWKEYGYELAGQAENGEEALLMARVLSPDIIISDIKMPVMDGLTLTREIKKYDPSIFVILLTGFDELALVKQALHLHVDEYLLKPADPEALLKTLEKISKTIHIRRKKEEQFRKLKEQFQTALPTLRSNLFSDLVAGRYPSEELALETFRLFEIPVGRYVVISAAYSSGSPEEGGNEQASALETHMILLTISGICKETFQNYTSDTLTFLSGRRIHFLLIFSSSIEEADCMSVVQLGTHKAKKTISQDLGAHLSFGISNMGESLTGIAALHYQSTYALNQCWFFHDDPTLYFRDIRAEEQQTPHITDARKEAFEKAVRTGDKKEADNYLSQLLYSVFPSGALGINQCKQLVIAALLQALQAIDRQNLSQADALGADMNWISRILDCHKLDELMAFARDFLDELMSASQKSALSRYDGTANRIVEYIKENYAQDLSLDLLSEHFHFSATYISRLIRRSYGRNFTEILSDTRLNEAKKLLQNSSLKTAEIGRAVGYHDTSYFIQSFKKRYGATPNEYRNIIQI